jgi:outer membrane protein
MNTLFRKLLISLWICALPSLALAAEAPPAAQTPPPSQSAVQTAPAAAQKAAETAAPPKSIEPAAAPATIRIGHVDLPRIGTDSEPGKADRAKLMERQKKFQAQIEAKRKQLDKQRAAIESKLSSLSPQQREAKSKEFGKKVEEFQKFGRTAEEQFQELQQEMSRTLYEKVVQAASEYGKAKGLTAVVSKQELLYAASGVDVQDVTDEVIKLLNQKAKK